MLAAPAGVAAFTSNVCEPAARPLWDSVVGLVHACHGPPSSWHCTVETASLTVKARFAAVWAVGFGGSEAGVIVTAIGNGSSVIAFTVPVSVGPPACSAYGGYSGCVCEER